MAERLLGRSGDVEVELDRFPYKACRCGRLAKWAFDPGLDFSTQLFFEGGVPFASRDARCVRCGSTLQSRPHVDLVAEARLEGLEPIGFRARVPGFECEACGLQYAQEGAFDDRSDGAGALSAAVADIGLD